ncbi:Crp/Fnr family transcriptional regulator [Algoriphagus boritolerans]|uniref:cAMP-binding domain of CRP or a regulatory subunit of cAMP-dependent protein kinases n=1 Tax=Algoriphagus boritolerans DSM 17298 = JCM 18970 TaxID=1120964 RepID=A0A1H5ZLY1_9BACT|nr:Crp/Fnr family transcriptional regulator [Algoriphagus boritolerans]SEG37232.1 cAMP-binding domain of CRP or a regulatory subunit of cAMP-dependent protein kinases [Algoriphagus boritolerans DSM 17298 = JCM 18970]
MDFGPFSFLAERKIEVSGKLLETVQLEKGHLIYQPPNRITPIFEIASGAVKIGSYTPDGEEVCYDILRPGDYFGNFQYLNGQFSEFAKSLTPVELRVYDVDFFKQLVTNTPTLAGWFFKVLVSRWCRVEERLFAIRSLTPQEKVRKILPYFQVQILDASGKRFSLREVVTLQDIADLTGLTRQTVSKVMREDIGRMTKSPNGILN